MPIMLDAQSALNFVVAQGRTMEAGFYKTKYPAHDYASVVPVVVQGPEWSIGTQFQIMDMAGEAKFLSGAGNDMPFTQVTKSTETHDYAMLGSGWEWNIEEISQAAEQGWNLNTDKANSAIMSVERTLYDIAMAGSVEKGWKGLNNQTGITTTDAPATGTGSSRYFSAKTPLQILSDLNTPIAAVHETTKEIELPNAMAFPGGVYNYLASTRMSDDNGQSILEAFRTNNIYTAKTGQPLMLHSVRSLGTAASDGSGRIIAYTKDPDVLRFHLPMPRKFLPVHQRSIMSYQTGVIARTGGLEVRRPGAMAYLDKVAAAS